MTEYGPDTAPVKRFKKVTVDPENPFFTSVNGVLFTKDMRTLVCYPCGKGGDSYKTPETVETIGAAAFANNVNLRKFDLSASSKETGTAGIFPM